MAGIYKKKTPYLIIVIFLGILIRAGFLVTPLMDSDQATFGLQGRHILMGEFPIFSWGYAYMGTFQSFFDALAFYVFGSNSLVLNSVTTFLSIFFILATYLLGREIFGETKGILCAALAALGPAYLTVHGAWARHGYMETLLFGSLILFISVRLARTEDKNYRARLFIFLGFISGLAFWTNFLIIVYLPACGLYLLIKDRRFFKKETFLVIPSFFLGSLPFWIYNLSNSFESLWIIGAGKKEPFIKNLGGAVLKGVPEMIGANSAKDTILEGFYFIVVFIFIVSSILLIFYGIRDVIGRKFRVQGSESGEERIFELNGIGIILLFLLSFFIIYSSSSFGSSITGTMRYLIPLQSVIPILAVLFLDRIEKHSKYLMMVSACLVLTINLYGNLKGYDFMDKKKLIQYREIKREEKSLFEVLKKKGISHAYVLDYWKGPKLTFEAKEEIIFSLPDKMERYPKYASILNNANRFAYVLSGGGSPDIKSFGENLKAMGIGYKSESINGFAVFHSFSSPPGLEEIPRAGWKAMSNTDNENAFKAVDGNVETAWFSGEPKKGWMWFGIDLGSVQRVSGISVLPGLIIEGNMSGYSLEVSKNGKNWKPIRKIDKDLIPWFSWYNGGPRYDLYHPRVKIVFNPVEAKYIRINHRGEDKYYYWTIGEVFVFRAAKGGDPSYRGLINEGKEFEAKEDYRGAMRKYREVVKVFGEREETFYRIAALMQDIGIPEGSSLDKAEVFDRYGLIEDAIGHYKVTYSSLYPSGSYGSYLLHRLAKLYEKAGDMDKAGYYRKKLVEEFAPSEKRSVNFCGLMEFLGYEIKEVRPQEIIYYWRARDDIRNDLKAFVHFIGSDGRIVFQNDHLLFSDERPSSKWIKGEVYKESLKVEVPENLRSGTYEIKIGLFDPKTEKRLKVKTGLFKKKNEITIGELKIN